MKPNSRWPLTRPQVGALEDEVNEFYSSTWGHRRTCWLVRAIREG